MRHFQANTERRRSVLSVFFLGSRLLASDRFKFTLKDIEDAFMELPKIACEQVKFEGIS